MASFTTISGHGAGIRFTQYQKNDEWLSCLAIHPHFSMVIIYITLMCVPCSLRDDEL